MIDPQLVADAFKKTTALPLPPPITTSVSPIPTITPDVPRFEKIGEAGTKTLWVRQDPRTYIPASIYRYINIPIGRLCHHAPLNPRPWCFDLENPNGARLSFLSTRAERVSDTL
jgi:hypothetical protein